MKKAVKEDLFAAVFEHNPVQTIAVDHEGRIIAVNKAKRESSDRLPEIGMVMYVDYASEHTIDMRAELMACMENHETQFFPERAYKEKIMSITITPFSEGAVIISEDITERKKMEYALKQSEERFRTLFEKIPGMAVQGYGLNGEVRLWNQASTALYGYMAEEAIGKNLLNLIIPSDMRSHVEEGMRWMMETGESLPSAELALQRKDGTLVQVFSSHALIKIPGREPELFCVDIDITERKEAERALQKSEELLRAITDAAQDAIIVMGSDGRISFWNPAAERILGYSHDNAIGQSLHECIAPEQCRDKCRSGISEFIQTGKGCAIGKTTDQKAQCADGRIIDVQLSLAAINLDDGWGSVGILRDVTECKIAENALRESEERFRLLSMTDALTKLFNRWHFSFEIKREIDRASRYGQPLSGIMFDVDDFKLFNERYGHAAGDRVLEIIGNVVQKSVRRNDIPCRIGGEEFFIILPMTTIDVARAIAFRISTSLKNENLDFAENKVITISCGVAQFNPEKEDLDMLVCRVDQLMREAKRDGKDRICY